MVRNAFQPADQQPLTTLSILYWCHCIAALLTARVRKSVRKLREERVALLAKGGRAVPIQAVFRGFLVRRDDRLVGVRKALL